MLFKKKRPLPPAPFTSGGTPVGIALKNGLHTLYRPAFICAASLGFGAWFLPQPDQSIGLGSLAGFALLEEGVFRAGIQEWLERLFKNKKGGVRVSLANILTSTLFVLSHLVFHSLFWSLATFFPSLIFGWFWTRHQNLIPCWMLHFLYNVFFFYRLN